MAIVTLGSCQLSEGQKGSVRTSMLWTADSLLHSNHTPSWEDVVAMSQILALHDSRASLHHIGWSDIGRPIHALMLGDSEGAFEAKGTDENPTDGLATLRSRLSAQHPEKVTVLINNAIHPGEPCGVNASLALAAEWLDMPANDDHPLKHVNWVIVPQYNIGGAARRNCCTRANQNGPELYGFRGNAANLDLNRDFIKMDSRNAEAFVELYHAVDPDVFVDTHTSNGADYPYTMTLITTQPDKAGPVIGPFLRDVLEPALFKGMDSAGWPMAPYVYSLGQTPDEGIKAFLETPRYSTGYTTLFGTLGFTTEAHMLKPFDQRVRATHDFLDVLAKWLAENGSDVKEIRTLEQQRIAQADTLAVRWRLSDQKDTIEFTGYSARREWSAVTQGTRLKYDRSQTWQKPIPYANRYEPVVATDVPRAWVLPQAWRRVAKRLQANHVEMRPLSRDSLMLVEVTWIEKFTSSPRPYEGHHPLTIDSVRSEFLPVQLYRGDWVIPSNQSAKRYLAEVLSPRSHDSFLAWNFFDAALQRKEYFSGYVFEDTAEELLASNEELRRSYQEAKASHPKWEESPYLALQWLYEQSPHDEKTAYRYPVYRLPSSGTPGKEVARQ